MRNLLNSGFLKPILFFRPYLPIIFTGVGCELIYLFYFAGTFPVLKYGRSLYLVDLDKITGASHTSFIIFLLALSVLFMLLGSAWWNIRSHVQYNTHVAFYLIFGFGAIFAYTMIFCYPITAIDVFIYIAQSHVLLSYHANPLVVPAATFAQDPLMRLAGQYGSTGAPYGPLGILLDALPTLIAGRDVLTNLLLLKGFFALTLLGCGWLVYQIVSRYAPRQALPALALFVWNPLILFEYCANSHNDILVVFFALLALFALTREHPVLAFACIIASASIKYATVPLLPLFFCYGLFHQSTHFDRLRYLIQLVGVSLFLIAIIYIPFWAGPHTFDSALGHDDWYLVSFSLLLSDLAPLHLTGEQGKLIGRVIFAVFYLYALFLIPKRLPGITRGSALVMFMFLAFGTVKFESWYAIWGIAFLVLVPTMTASLVVFLFSFGTLLIAPFFAYLWIWGGASGNMYGAINSFCYLVAFLPALLLLCANRLQSWFIEMQTLPDPTPPVPEVSQPVLVAASVNILQAP